MNDQRMGTSMDRALEAQKNFWDKENALPKASSGSPMPPIKPAVPAYVAAGPDLVLPVSKDSLEFINQQMSPNNEIIK